MGFRSNDFDKACCLRYQAMRIPYWMPHNSADSSEIVALTTVASMSVGTPLTLNAASGFYEAGELAFPAPHVPAFTTTVGDIDAIFQVVGLDWKGKLVARDHRISAASGTIDRFYGWGGMTSIQSITPIEINDNAGSLTMGFGTNIASRGDVVVGGIVMQGNNMETLGNHATHVKGVAAEVLTNFPNLYLQPDHEAVPAPYGPHLGEVTLVPGNGATQSGRATIICDPRHF